MGRSAQSMASAKIAVSKKTIMITGNACQKGAIPSDSAMLAAPIEPRPIVAKVNNLRNISVRFLRQRLQCPVQRRTLHLSLGFLGVDKLVLKAVKHVRRHKLRSLIEL